MRKTILVLLVSLLAGTLSAQNMVVNPDFDLNADGWVILPAASWTSFDRENSPDSGSVFFANSGTGNGGYTFASQCIELPVLEDGYIFGAFLYIAPGSTTGGISYSSLWWYSGSGCSSFITADSSTQISNTGVWTISRASGVPPGGTQSALITFTNQRYGDGSFDVYVDSAFLEPARIFSNGFESSDTCGWDASVGKSGQ